MYLICSFEQRLHHNRIYKPCQTSVMERFCKYNDGAFLLLAVNYFRKKAPSEMFDRVVVLNIPLDTIRLLFSFDKDVKELSWMSHVFFFVFVFVFLFVCFFAVFCKIGAFERNAF